MTNIDNIYFIYEENKPQTINENLVILSSYHHTLFFLYSINEKNIFI